ncbi:hypothetical protein [Pseudoclavibacter helvolus]|uniref:hypothetical protein n=1 Tax=Pseudoclavibacter helvolus TaxID=255205 RepID=UPI003736C89C
MPEVTFQLRTFGLEATRDLLANVVFTPSRDGAIGLDGMLVRRVLVPFSSIDAITGRGQVTLARTVGLKPPTHYDVSVEWLDPALEGWASISVPIHVPASGGDLSDLVDFPSTGEEWWVAPESPPINDSSFLWLDPETDDVFRWE